VAGEVMTPQDRMKNDQFIEARIDRYICVVSRSRLPQEQHRMVEPSQALLCIARRQEASFILGFEPKGVRASRRPLAWLLASASTPGC
jgi:hypothetical protein